MDKINELDTETIAALVRYYGHDPRIPQTVTDEVFSEYSGEEWTLAEFLTFINEAIESIPPECRESATVKLEGSCDESTRLVMSYERLETAAEVARKVARGLAYVRGKQEDDRATYERLKAKFG